MFTYSPGLLATLLFAFADAPQRETPPVVLAHQKPVFGLAFTPDSRTLVSGEDDGLIHIWDVATRRELRQWKAHEGGLLALALTGDGTTLATAGRDGSVRRWNMTTGKETWKYDGLPGDVEGLSLSADGKVLIVSSSGQKGTFRTSRQGLVFS